MGQTPAQAAVELPVAKPSGPANLRKKCYGSDVEETDDYEQVSRVLTIDDFAPNFTSQKPISPTAPGVPGQGVPGQSAQMVTLGEGSEALTSDRQQVMHTLVSFRNTQQESLGAASHAEKVAAAL